MCATFVALGFTIAKGTVVLHGSFVREDVRPMQTPVGTDKRRDCLQL